eukprot:1790711-Alexandrium_andersonii.AAC.1
MRLDRRVRQRFRATIGRISEVFRSGWLDRDVGRAPTGLPRDGLASDLGLPSRAGGHISLRRLPKELRRI